MGVRWQAAKFLLEGVNTRTCGNLERVKGIEPSSVAWEATALPLSYTRERSIIEARIRRYGRRTVPEVQGRM